MRQSNGYDVSGVVDVVVVASEGMAYLKVDKRAAGGSALRTFSTETT